METLLVTTKKKQKKFLELVGLVKTSENLTRDESPFSNFKQPSAHRTIFPFN